MSRSAGIGAVVAGIDVSELEELAREASDPPEAVGAGREREDGDATAGAPWTGFSELEELESELEELESERPEG